MRVVAVDSRTISRGSEQRNQAPEVKVPSNITVAVTAEDAQRIRLAEKNGTVSLMLRSLEDKNNMQKTTPTEVSGIFSGAAGDAVVIVRGVTVERSSSSIVPLDPSTMGDPSISSETSN